MIHVSLYTPTNRPYLWLQFCNNIVTDLTYEIIFVGDVHLSALDAMLLPECVTFIDTSVKLSQCAYIGAKRCGGDVIIQVCDDLVIYPYVLDKMYETYLKENDYKCMVYPKFGKGDNGPNHDDTESTMGPIDFGIGAMMSKRVFDEVGSFDRRYFNNTYDADLQFHIRSEKIGGRHVWRDDVYMWEEKSLAPGGMYGGSWYKYGGIYDVRFLESQWYTPEKTLKPESTTPLEPFEDNDTLLTVSQGEVRGDWDEIKRLRKERGVI